MRSIFIGNINDLQRVYSKSRKLLESEANCNESFYDKETLLKSNLNNVEYIFSTWGMLCLTESEIKTHLPNLKAVFYAAGSVKSFAEPFLKCGVAVFSAWAANAIPVAEYAASQIILANKGFYLTSILQKQQRNADAVNLRDTYNGNFGTSVGIIGAGMIGAKVIEILHKITSLNILVFDPYLSDEKAKSLNVTKVSLDELFKNSQTISNHLADNEHTRGMLDYSLFSIMQENAVFINTGRGAQVVEDDLIKALKEKPLLTAVLDVTMPEPPQPNHPFYNLLNVVLTPHIAGSNGLEVCRMADYMVMEFFNILNDKPTKYSITLDMLKTIA